MDIFPETELTYQTIYDPEFMILRCLACLQDLQPALGWYFA